MTDAELSELETKAKAATPGPWACWGTVKKIFTVVPEDWGCVYAYLPEYGCPGVLFTANRNMVTDAEKKQAREEHTDPGQSGRNAAYAAAVNPTVVLSLITELRQAKDKIRILEKEADWLAQTAANDGWHGRTRVSRMFMREQARRAAREGVR